MRLAKAAGDVQLTYCTNIHAGETWPDIAGSLDAHVPAIKAAVSPGASLGIGLRLSGIAAETLGQPEELARFRAQLEELGAHVFTINAFPYGPFHGTRVKEHVYEPDWRTEERVVFTARVAHILADLLAEGGRGSVSTVPGAFRTAVHEAGAVDRIADNFLRAGAELARLERRTGRLLQLAIEPEPRCLMETTDEAIAFIEERLLSADALARFGQLADAAPSEALVRRHVGVCFDVCHAAVEFEDCVGALRSLEARGIAVPKIQLSSAMRVPRIDEAAVRELRRFDTGVYLHQVVARNGSLRRFVDLPEAFAAFGRGEADGEWRVHCHVPLFVERFGAIGSTRADLVAVIDEIRRHHHSPHLEVETYTWDVLPDDLKTGSKSDDIAREMAFVIDRLDG